MAATDPAEIILGVSVPPACARDGRTQKTVRVDASLRYDIDGFKLQ
jgi:hypothetical protein